jgi:hypothetical protein
MKIGTAANSHFVAENSSFAILGPSVFTKNANRRGFFDYFGGRFTGGIIFATRLASRLLLQMPLARNSNKTEILTFPQLQQRDQ